MKTQKSLLLIPAILGMLYGLAPDAPGRNTSVTTWLKQVPGYNRSHSDSDIISDTDMVSQCRVHADKTLFANLDTTRNDHMGCDESMILDHRVMPNVIAAP